MKKILPILIAVLLAFLSVGTGSLAETAAEPTPTPEPLGPFEESPKDIHVKEEDGGEFRSLPLDMLQGGAKMVSFKYSPEITIYEDPSIRVEYHRVQAKKTWGVVYYFADIVIKEPTQMRTAFATGTTKFNPNYKKPVRGISTKLNAVIAINGDFFAAGAPNAFVLRQGDVYQDAAETNLDILLVDEDGDFHVLTASENLPSIDKTQVDGKKVINAFQFGPALVIDGQPVADELLVDRGHSPKWAQPDMANQRMGIIQVGKLHYMVLTCSYYGLTLPKFRDLAMYISGYKATTVFTLDGGNSSQIVFLGRKRNNVDNNPETNKDKEGERPVADIVYWASAWFTQ